MVEKVEERLKEISILICPSSLSVNHCTDSQNIATTISLFNQYKSRHHERPHSSSFCSSSTLSAKYSAAYSLEDDIYNKLSTTSSLTRVTSIKSARRHSLTSSQHHFLSVLWHDNNMSTLNLKVNNKDQNTILPLCLTLHNPSKCPHSRVSFQVVKFSQVWGPVLVAMRGQKQRQKKQNKDNKKQLTCQYHKITRNYTKYHWITQHSFPSSVKNHTKQLL